MGITRKVKCDSDKCTEFFEEALMGLGFPGWGTIAGVENPETGASEMYLCPHHLQQLLKKLNEE